MSKKFKIVQCKNPKCPNPRFMVEKGKFERYCSGDCRVEHKSGSDIHVSPKPKDIE